MIAINIINQVKMIIKDYATIEEKKLAVELAGLIGFHSLSIEFPVTTDCYDIHKKDTIYFILGKCEEKKNIVVDNNDFYIYSEDNTYWTSIKNSNGIEAAFKFISDNFNGLTKDFTQNSREIEIKDFVSSTKSALPMKPLYDTAKKGLEYLFEKDFLMKDCDNDGLPDRFDAAITLDSYDISVVRAACELNCRFGLEMVTSNYPVLSDDIDLDRNTINFTAEGSCSIEMEDSVSLNIKVNGVGDDLIRFITNICSHYPIAGNDENHIVDFVDVMRESFAMKNLDGQLCYLEANKKKINNNTTCYFSPDVQKKYEKLKAAYPEVEFKKYIDFESVYEKEFDIPWEVDVAKDILIEKLFPVLNSGDIVEIYGALSEDIDARVKVKEFIEKEVYKKGANVSNCEIICAYKQGFSWLEEVVTPKLVDKDIKSMTVYFKPFMKPGEKDWGDVDGRSPSYKTDGDPEKWFDLPLRYLQELYPVDDIICAKLGISRDDIHMEIYEGDEDITYLVEAISQEDKKVFSDTYKAAYIERPYLDIFPNMGLVHPSTGYIKAVVNGKTIVNERVATDLESVWDIYQTRVLGYCKEFIDKQCDGKPTEDMQPFFAQMKMEIGLSETERELGTRQDLFSPLNALHEDIYFAGLDFFKTYGMTTTGANLEAPGLMLPIIEQKEGKPYFKFTHYKSHSNDPFIDFDGSIVESSVKKQDVTIYIDKLYDIDNKVGMSFVVDSKGNTDSLAESMSNLIHKSMLQIGEELSAYGEISIKTSENRKGFSAKLPKYTEERKQYIDIEDIDILENQLIGYEQYIEIMEQLKHVKGIKVFKSGQTYQGRDIYTIRILPDFKGYVSTNKLINLNPTELINSRHHANEVSATNAAFMVLKEILTNEKYKGLGNRMNLLITPMENADGAAIHYELQKQHPTWIFHIARYNSLGKEFYRDYYDIETIHTEAYAVRRLYYRWLPDVFVDNHGVPSHEWEQQFAGYTSPWFKGFWLPRALLYGYYWYNTDECYKNNKKLNEQLADAIADSLIDDNEIQEWNMDWKNRHEKYAHRWMPKLFPADYYKNMINYWVPSSYNPKHGYMAVRFPWITAISFTSEVADETAQDEYLYLCARTHKMHTLAGIDMILNSRCVYEKSSLKYIRNRPPVLE